MSVLEHALAAARRGWRVFPVEPDGKRPLVADWENTATTEEAAIRAWLRDWPCMNYGVACGPSGLFVVDADTKENGLDTLAGLELEGLLPCTLEVGTPSGGRHLYFAGSGSSTVRKLGAGVDSRGRGGYVVGPGSGINGRGYEILADRPVAGAPGELIARAGAGIAAAEDQAPATELDLPENIERAAEYLRRTAPAIEGAGGNNHTYKTAALVRDFGISEGACLDLLRAHFNPRCSPPWDDSDLETIVNNAYSYAKRAPGEARADADALDKLAVIAEQFLKLASKDEPPDPRKPAGRFRVLGWHEILAMPDPKWLVHDTITERGLVLVYGPTSSYKSFVALDIALHIATGSAWCGRSILAPSPVIYCAGEGAHGIRKRVNAWATKHERETLSNFGMVPTMPLFGDDEELRQFAQECAAFRPKLLVFDTVAHAMAGLDENAQKDSGLFVARCNQMARALDCSVVLVHHTGKDQARGARGSTVLPGACDTIFEVTKPRPLEVVVRMSKQKDAEAWDKPLGMAAEAVAGSLVFSPAAVTASLEELTGAAYSETARKLLDDWPEEFLPIGVTELAKAIAEELGTENAKAVRDYLRRTGSRAPEMQPYIAERAANNSASKWGRPKF